MPRAVEFVLRIRAGLERFDCATEQGWFGMYVWWTMHGRHDYPSFTWQLRESDKEYLFATTGRRLPRALELYAQDRPDLQALVDDADLGFEKYILWWLGDGQQEAFVAQTAPDLSFYLSSGTDASNSETRLLPVALQCIWHLRSDLQEAFDINTKLGQEKLLAWWRYGANLEYPLVIVNESASVEQLRITSSQSAMEANLTGNDAASDCMRGVNVIGFAGGVLGIGEDARMAAEAARRAGFQVSALKPALLGAPIESPDLKTDDKVRSDKFPVSIFCLPPTEMIRLVLEGSGELLNSRQYKIGAWPWELPTWPKNLNGIVNLVDEIWAQSRFVAKSFSALSSIEIHHVPLAIEIPCPTHRVRKKFRLPEKDFLYYIMFDGNSWLTRKNPLGGVKAFQYAFNQRQNGVGLVIKAMNINTSNPIWQEITRLSGQDHRIHIISDTLSRQDLINLMASCDSCLSLHRSEGFGRVIAEAMLLGQPAVVTNYSGNTDFCTPSTAFLVNGELKPLKTGDYIFSEGQHWCEPDIEHAAEQLRKVFYEPKHREEVAKAGKQLIAEKYSASAVSRVYHERLSQIFEKLDIN